MKKGVKKETWIAISLLGVEILIAITLQVTNPISLSPGLNFNSLQDYLTQAPDITTGLTSDEIMHIIDNELKTQKDS